MDLVRDAGEPWSFLRSHYAVVLPALVEYYELLLGACDPSANAADLRILSRMLPELEAQVSWGMAALERDPDPDRSRGYADKVRSALDEVGGLATGQSVDIDWPHPNAAFVPPREIVFDDRIAELPLMSLEERQSLPYEENLREQFYVFFNEMYAASMLATIVYEAIDTRVAWKLVFGLSRHFWDEVRHSEFGAVRLKELGYEPDRCNQELFKNGLDMSLLHRICYLTMVLEPYYMPRKKPRFKEYEEAGDTRSQLFADHDWSDEINHVRFGKDALEFLLEDDARDIERLKEEVLEILAKRGVETSALSPF
jgi:hypothetical protein